MRTQKARLETEKIQTETARDNLQSQIDNHRCPNCPLEHLDNHNCRSCNLLHCSEEYHQQLVKNTEQQIVSKIITELELSTNQEQEKVLEAIIAEIKSKITPPQDTADKERIAELESQVNYLQSDILQQKPQQSFVDRVIELSKELGVIDNQTIQEFKTSETYQELLNKKTSLVKSELDSKENRLNSVIEKKARAEKLNYMFGGLSIGSLLVILWMTLKQFKKKRS